MQLLMTESVLKTESVVSGRTLFRFLCVSFFIGRSLDMFAGTITLMHLFLFVECC